MAQSFLVVGTGIIGAATAFQLTNAGHSVMVVDGGFVDATRSAFGWINASFYIDDDHHRLRAEGIRAWRRVQEGMAVNLDWQGCLCWDMSTAEIERTYAQLRTFDYPAEILDATQIEAREPNLRHCPQQALYFPNEGAVASNEIAQQFLDAAQALGAKLIRNVQVTAIKMRGDTAVGVDTAQGAILADQVIIAAGTGTSALAASMGQNIPMVSRPAYIMRTAPQAPLLSHILATPDGEIRQEPSGRLLMPVAVGHQGDDAQSLTQTPVATAESAMSRLRAVCRGLEHADWSEVIRAERPVPADNLPVVGALAEGVYAAVLHSGITLGPVIAELIVKDLTGKLANADAAMLAPYRPDRFSAP